MSLAQYLKSFFRLRTYKDRKKWSDLTTHQAPHKAFPKMKIKKAGKYVFRFCLFDFVSLLCDMCNQNKLTSNWWLTHLRKCRISSINIL